MHYNLVYRLQKKHKKFLYLDCRKAISSEINDYEDAIMVETAIRSEMDCIVTRNVKDYTKSSVKVCEPSAFLKLLEAEDEIE